jgi:galactoside O-acetyltransferase
MNLIKKIKDHIKYKYSGSKNLPEESMRRCFIHSSSILRSFSVRFDNPLDNKIYLSIGKDCIVSGCFIFESQDGVITIGEHCFIGGGTYISHSSIEIGNNVTIAWGGTVYDHDSHSLNYLDRRKDIDDELNDIRNGRNFIQNKDWANVNSKPIKICDDAWIGMNVLILKGVTIGRGSIVGAGSVVTKDVPDWTVVAGNPAVVVKTLDKNNVE